MRARAALVAILAGCVSVTSSQSLTIWHSWGGAELATLKALINNYRQAHPKVEILALQIPHDRLLDKFTRSSAANGGPDVLIGDNDWSGKLAQSGLLAPIFDESGAPGAPVFARRYEDLFSKQTLAALRLGSKIYAWPESLETVVLYYNRRLLPTPPDTASHMLDLAESTKIQDGYGLVFNTDFYFFAGYFLGGGGRIFNAEHQLQIDTPAGRSMLGWLEDLSRRPGCLLTNEYGKADSLYKQGKAAMILNGPWALSDYQKVLGPDLGVAPLPMLAADRPAAPWIGVKCLMVNANADAAHRTLAKDFCRFIDTPSSQMQLSNGCGHIPALRSVSLPLDSPLKVFQQQALTGTPKGADPKLAVVWDPLSRAIQEVLQHKYSPAQALTRAQETVYAKLRAVEANEQEGSL